MQVEEEEKADLAVALEERVGRAELVSVSERLQASQPERRTLIFLLCRASTIVSLSLNK